MFFRDECSLKRWEGNPIDGRVARLIGHKTTTVVLVLDYSDGTGGLILAEVADSTLCVAFSCGCSLLGHGPLFPLFVVLMGVVVDVSSLLGQHSVSTVSLDNGVVSNHLFEGAFELNFFLDLQKFFLCLLFVKLGDHLSELLDKLFAIVVGDGSLATRWEDKGLRIKLRSNQVVIDIEIGYLFLGLKR